MSYGKPMEDLLASLRAAAEPTRLRLLALARAGRVLRVRVHARSSASPSRGCPAT